MNVVPIAPEALDEMKVEKGGDWYMVPGEPNIYIDFMYDGAPRVHIAACPGEDVDFPHVTTMERLEMLLDAISATPTAQEAFDALFEKGESK